MTYPVQSLNISLPGSLLYEGRQISTSFAKKPVREPIFLSKEGFEGDRQADLKNHGGREKAVLLYAYSHYEFWENYYSRSFSLPSFGENITIDGISEEEVHIGDIFQLGEAVIEICQPRNPCYKIAALHQLKNIPSVVTQTGYSGFYARVLEEGMVASDSKLVLKQGATEEPSIAAVFRTIFHSPDIAVIDKILASDKAAASLKKQLQKKYRQ